MLGQWVLEYALRRGQQTKERQNCTDADNFNNGNTHREQKQDKQLNSATSVDMPPQAMKQMGNRLIDRRQFVDWRVWNQLAKEMAGSRLEIVSDDWSECGAVARNARAESVCNIVQHKLMADLDQPVFAGINPDVDDPQGA